MVRIEEVAELALALPEVVEGEQWRHRSWLIGKKAFAWERPFSKADLKRFGDEVPPDGPIVAVRVEDLAEKEAVLEAGHRGFFTIPHFDNYPAVLIQLKKAAKKPVREALVDGWLACAPAKLAEAFVADEQSKRSRISRHDA